MEPRTRHALALTLSIIIGTTCAMAITAWQVWGGAIRSGGAFLTLPNLRPAMVHDHGDDPPPRHKGFVDTSSGLYVREDEDVVLSHGQPFRLTRTYLSGYHVPRSFGVGTTSNADWNLIGDLNDLSSVNLILADGGRIRFDRVSGTTYDDSVWIHRSTPTRFNGARLGWTGFDWGLRFTDGGVARFLPCAPGAPTECLLTELRDEDGHTLTFVRDAVGTLLRIEGENTHITFKHDAALRVAQVTSPEGQIDYRYDSRGRLVHVREYDGAERDYTYDDRNELLTISEPGWFIQNTWDDDERMVSQTTVIPGPPVDSRRPGTYTIGFAYKVVNNQVVETDITEYDGTHTLRRFNGKRYMISEVDDAGGLNPVTATYQRNPETMRTETVTVSCMKNGRRITASAPMCCDEHETKAELKREHCASPEPNERAPLFAAS